MPAFGAYTQVIWFSVQQSILSAVRGNSSASLSQEGRVGVAGLFITRLFPVSVLPPWSVGAHGEYGRIARVKPPAPNNSPSRIAPERRQQHSNVLSDRLQLIH